jgi:acyl-ACP thioesterase
VWPLRSADVDLHGHVNNAVHWQAVEDALSVDGTFPLGGPLRAELDYRDPLDLGDDLAISVSTSAKSALVGLHVGDAVKAVARVEPLPEAE